MSAKGAEDFMKKPVAKKKADRLTGDRYDEQMTRVKHPRVEHSDPKNVSGGVLRGVMSETMARVYEELFPTMSVRDEQGTVDIEIQEETYILGLTMICGTDDFKPRKPLKIREVEISDNARYCKEHR